MNALKRTVLILFSGFAASTAYSQIHLRAEVINGDTIPYAWLPTVNIYDKIPNHVRSRYLKNRKLIRNIKKVMPYAVACANRLDAIDAELKTIEDEKEQRKFLKREEKKLKQDYEADLRKLTFSQGKLLIKMIDRECGRSSYDLIDMYKSKRSAFFWNGFAGIFGVSLKDEYDPDEEQEIEFLIAYLGYK